jgi:gas vesicle protein
MYYEDQPTDSFSFFGGLIVGVVLGAGIALLAAPASGKRTRRRMLRQVVSAKRAAGEQVDDWADELRSALRAGRRRRIAG